MDLSSVIYLLATDDIDRLDTDLDVCAAPLAAMFGADVTVVPELRFAQFTGLSYYVYDEIGLVLASSAAFASNPPSVHAFAERWALEPRLDVPVMSLSGGWRKHLLQALLLDTAPPSQVLVVQALSQYLADDLIALTLRNLAEARSVATVLAEWDCRTVLPLVASPGLIEIVRDERAPATGENGNLPIEDRERGAFGDRRQLRV
jgi:hypothetical protein